MAGMFPAQMDGGIPANPSTPDNPPQAFPGGEHTQPTDTSALYYGLGCDAKIRAPVLNSIISELFAICDAGGVPYTAGSLDNVARAIFQSGAIAAARAEIKDLQTKIDTLQKDVAQLRADVDKLKGAQALSIPAEPAALRKEIDGLKAELDALKERIMAWGAPGVAGPQYELPKNGPVGLVGSS